MPSPRRYRNKKLKRYLCKITLEGELQLSSISNPKRALRNILRLITIYTNGLGSYGRYGAEDGFDFQGLKNADHWEIVEIPKSTDEEP
jgi:hypothetical protein